MSRLKKFAKAGMKLADAGLDVIDVASGHKVPWRTKDVVRIVKNPDRLRRILRARATDAVHVGRRGEIRATTVAGAPRLVKRFTDDDALAREARAHALFGAAPWKMPILALDGGRLEMPQFANEARLDRAARRMSAEERERVAVDAVAIAFELFCAGVAHRDFHAENFFYVDDTLVLSDFETIEEYDTRALAFTEAYDVTGRGLPSPHDTRAMHYAHPAPQSLQSVLGVPLERAIAGFRARLVDELRDACRSFQGKQREGSGGRRHQCKTDRVYGSFTAGDLVVDASSAQRDSTKRFARFGVYDAVLRGRTLLDLGCNVGGMSFAAQRFAPRASLGIEYDAEKVRVANRVLRYAGWSKAVEIRQGNVDLLGADLGVFDVVFCLAIESHVADPAHLYRLLGEVTGDVLYFEGNAGCDTAVVERNLRDAGFASVVAIGACDDDARAENNTRPLWVARKAKA